MNDEKTEVRGLNEKVHNTMLGRKGGQASLFGRTRKPF